MLASASEICAVLLVQASSEILRHLLQNMNQSDLARVLNDEELLSALFLAALVWLASLMRWLTVSQSKCSSVVQSCGRLPLICQLLALRIRFPSRDECLLAVQLSLTLLCMDATYSRCCCEGTDSGGHPKFGLDWAGKFVASNASRIPIALVRPRYPRDKALRRVAKIRSAVTMERRCWGGVFWTIM